MYEKYLVKSIFKTYLTLCQDIFQKYLEDTIDKTLSSREYFAQHYPLGLLVTPRCACDNEQRTTETAWNTVVDCLLSPEMSQSQRYSADVARRWLWCCASDSVGSEAKWRTEASSRSGCSTATVLPRPDPRTRTASYHLETSYRSRQLSPAIHLPARSVTFDV